MPTFVSRPDIQLKSLVVPHPTNPYEPSTVFEPNAVYELSTGSLAAVYYSAKRTPANTLSCHCVAWMVDDDGDPQSNVDFAGIPICVDFKHNSSAHELRTLGASGLAAELVNLVLGEIPSDPPAIPWAQEIFDSVNLKNAITVAQATGPIADLVLATHPEVL